MRHSYQVTLRQPAEIWRAVRMLTGAEGHDLIKASELALTLTRAYADPVLFFQAIRLPNPEAVKPLLESRNSSERVLALHC